MKMMKMKKEMMAKHPKSRLLANSTFTYFDIRGRGEVTRLLFAAAQQNITERRVTFEEWPELKPKMPFGQVPVLNVSGKAFAQSMAIQKFVAQELGMYPRHHLAQLMTDQIANAKEDLFIAESRVNFAEDEFTRSTENQTLFNAYPIYLGNFEKFIKENRAKSGYVIGDELSLADIIIFEGTQSLVQNYPQMLDQYPHIRALRARVAATEGV